jgi:putative ABC transport system permease protein
MNTAGWLETVAQDLRYAFRMIRRSPATSAVALLSLMLGIGATTAIFSVVYGVLVSPYPYAKPGEIWAFGVRPLSGQGGHAYTLDDLDELKKVPALADVMATTVDNLLLTGDFAPETLTAVKLTPNGFNFLGVPPQVGRTFQPSDVGADGEAPPVVVISYVLWQRLFDGNPNAIGRTLRIDDKPRTIIGVMPPRFGWYTHDGVWLPLNTNRREPPQWLNPIARLQPGLSPEVAKTQLHALHLRLASEKPDTFPKGGFSTQFLNYLDITVASGEMRTTLQLLFGAVGFLLLIACANVANLQLARATARAREMAVRVSVGAARGRVLRQLLTESLLLSVFGGVLGVLFAFIATRAIVALMPEFYVPNEARVTINAYVLIFSLAVAVLTGILFGLAPALQASRPDLVETLKEAGRGAGAGARTGRMRSALVITEVALSVVLLVSAGLTIRSFIALQQSDYGFNPDHLLRLNLPLAPTRYRTLEQRNQFSRELLDRVKAIPGVDAVAIGTGGLPFGGPRSPFTIQGQPNGDKRPITVNFVSADYLRALGIPLRGGRTLTDHEVERGDRVALINEAARKLWPAGEDPLGRRIHLNILERDPSPTIPILKGDPDVMVVGIVGNLNMNPRTPADPAVLIPYTLVAPSQRGIAIRTQGDPMLVLNPLREQVKAMDKDQPLMMPTTMQDIIGNEMLAQPRFAMALFGFFAALGLALATAGIYSLLSYQVTLRTHEIGIRVALGAGRNTVVGLMLAMGGKLVAIGLGLGLIASVMATSLIRSVIVGVSPTDPLSFIIVAIVLTLVTMAACYVPARRAGAVDPMKALRRE